VAEGLVPGLLEPFLEAGERDASSAPGGSPVSSPHSRVR
jgi:hypothetical protein